MFKECMCGHVWTSEYDWRQAEYVGIQEINDMKLELRNCGCGSTCAIVVKPAPLGYTVTLGSDMKGRVTADGKDVDPDMWYWEPLGWSGRSVWSGPFPTFMKASGEGSLWYANAKEAGHA